MVAGIIDETNWQDAASYIPPGMSKGRMARDYGKVPYGALPGAQPFDLTLIPRGEWPDRIAELVATKTQNSDIALAYNIPSLDQNGTNYCWCNAVVTCVLIRRAQMGLPYVPLSPASVAAQVKGYSNTGGWGGEALDWITKNGICTAATWPANAISRSYCTAAAKAEAAKHKVTEWYELPSGNFDAVATCCLLRIPVAIGLNWWSHEVCACDLVDLGSGKFGCRIRNSWSDSYGEKGFAVLVESKATPDDACAPLVPMAIGK